MAENSPLLRMHLHVSLYECGLSAFALSMGGIGDQQELYTFLTRCFGISSRCLDSQLSICSDSCIILSPKPS